MVFSLKQILRARGLSNFFLRLPISQHLAEDDGVGEISALKVYIGKELVVERGEQLLDIRFVEARAFENDHRAGDGAVGEVVEIHRGKVLAIAEGEKALGRCRAQGAFPGEVHDREVTNQ